MAKYRNLRLCLFSGIFGLLGCQDAVIDLHGRITFADDSSAVGGALGRGGVPNTSTWTISRAGARPVTLTLARGGFPSTLTTYPSRGGVPNTPITFPSRGGVPNTPITFPSRGGVPNTPTRTVPGLAGAISFTGPFPIGGFTGTVTGPQGRGGATGSFGGARATSAPCWEFNLGETNAWQPTWAAVASLSDPAVRDEAASSALLTGTAAEITSTRGFTDARGAAELLVPFAVRQSTTQMLYYSTPLATAPVDLRGRKLAAYVKLVAGMTADDPSKPSGARLVIKTGANYLHADGGWHNLAKDNWVRVTLNADAPTFYAGADPSLYDPSDVREIGIAINTPGEAMAIEAPGLVQIDHVCLY